MLHGSPRPGVAGSELTRFLARLADVPAGPPRSVVSERLGHWLGWTGAIALSSVLNAAPPAAGARATCAPGQEEADFRRVRASLEASIAAGPDEPVPDPTDFAPYRRHCLARQHDMQEAVGALRQRLRAALARRSPAGARLAAIDAVLDQALAGQERTLLGLVPLRLQAHFERLRHGAGDDGRWRGDFRADMDHLLRCELAHRLLPVQGLLDTLGAHEPT